MIPSRILFLAAIAAALIISPVSAAIPPVANFTADNTSICLGDPIQFTDTSDNIPTEWLWDFYDGNTSTEQNPVYTYVSLGVFGVSLNATNPAGSDTEIKKDYVTVIDCAMDPEFVADHPCQIGVPVTVNFTGNCEEGPYHNYWEWNDGMGNHTEGVQNPQFTWEFYGVYNVDHTCEYGNASPTWVNKTDYIIVGVEGTECDDGRDTSCTYQINDSPGIAWTAPFILVGASIGMIIMGRRKKKKNEEEF